MQALDDDEDVEWGEDTSDAAVARRMKDLSDAAKNLAISDDIEKTPQERIDMFYSYVKVTKSEQKWNFIVALLTRGKKN